MIEQWDNINNSADEWFQKELLALDCSDLVHTGYCIVHLYWPYGDRLTSVLCCMDQYEHDGTGFEIINFTPALDWANANGFDPGSLRIEVNTTHTHINEILRRVAVEDKVMNAKLRDLSKREKNRIDDSYWKEWR